MPSIVLVPLRPVADELLGMLVAPIADVFRMPVRVDPPQERGVEHAFDPSRGQYNSTSLITSLLSQYNDPDEKVLGVTGVDLFVPVLTYVFGEAQLNGIAGVMSIFRYNESIYGLAPDPVLSFERSVKEAVHELGHTFGLLHCVRYDCAMHSSTTVDDVDEKGSGLCEECRRKIGRR
jgi:archaemetzincin